MRKLVLFIICLIAFHNGNAQITVTQSDLPTIGSNWASINDNTTQPGATLSAPGGNQNWDFSSGWTVTDTTITQFVSPNGLTGFSSFQNANLGVTNPSAGVDNNFFYRSTSSGLFIEGFYQNYTGLLAATITGTNYLVLPTPMSYGTNVTFIRTFTQVIIYDSSIAQPAEKSVNTEYGSFVCDAWGSLITPVQTANVLRVLENVTGQVDSSFIDSTGTGTNFAYTSSTTNGASVNYSYTFVKNGPGIIAMTFKADTLTGAITYGSYFDINITGIKTPTTNAKADVFPNPASGMVNFKTDGNTGNHLTVFDATGRENWNYDLSGVSLLTVSTARFINGIYVYRITDNNGALIKTGKLTIQN